MLPKTAKANLRQLLLAMYDIRSRFPCKEILDRNVKEGQPGADETPTVSQLPSYFEGVRVIQTAEAVGAITHAEGDRLMSWVYDLTTEMGIVTHRDGTQDCREMPKHYVTPDPERIRITAREMAMIEPMLPYPI